MTTVGRVSQPAGERRRQQVTRGTDGACGGDEDSAEGFNEVFVCLLESSGRQPGPAASRSAGAGRPDQLHPEMGTRHHQ